MLRNPFILSVLCMLLSCNQLQKGNDSNIKIEIDRGDAFFVNQENIPAEKLKDYLLKEVEKIQKKGFAREDITIFIKAHSEVKIGKLADLQMILRELRIKKIVYTSE